MKKIYIKPEVEVRQTMMSAVILTGSFGLDGSVNDEDGSHIGDIGWGGGAGDGWEGDANEGQWDLEW